MSTFVCPRTNYYYNVGEVCIKQVAVPIISIISVLEVALSFEKVTDARCSDFRLSFTIGILALRIFLISNLVLSVDLNLFPSRLFVSGTKLALSGFVEYDILSTV